MHYGHLLSIPEGSSFTLYDSLPSSAQSIIFPGLSPIIRKLFHPKCPQLATCLSTWLFFFFSPNVFDFLWRHETSPTPAASEQQRGALLQRWHWVWTWDAVLHSICKATCSPFPMPASCQKKYPDNTWERLSLGPAADCRLPVLNTRQNRRGLCSWMSSSDKGNSGWKMPSFWKTGQRVRLQTDRWYENLTEQNETSDSNYLEAVCCP